MKQNDIKKRSPSTDTDFTRRQAEVDPSNLKQDFDSWPDIARKAWDADSVPTLEWKGVESVLLAGMGGSGITGDLVHDLATELNSELRFDVIKDYHLPSNLDKGTLVVAISCSGNTEETASILSEAVRKQFRSVAFSSGGFIERFSKKNENLVKFVRTNALKVPRSSLPFIFYPVLKFLLKNNLLLISEKDVEESLASLASVGQDFGVVTANMEENNAYVLASKIVNQQPSFPLVYSSRRTRAVGLRFRQSLNENAKLHAFDGIIPELSHNEIVGWDNKKSQSADEMSGHFAPVLLALEDDPPEISARMEIIRSIIEGTGTEVLKPSLKTGVSYFSRILSMLYFLDYSTYYASILRGIDPIQTPSIGTLKQSLKEQLDYFGRIESEWNQP